MNHKINLRTCIWATLLVLAVRRLAAGQVETTAMRVRPSRTWDDLVLDDDRLAHLREIAVRQRRRDIVFGKWGFSPHPSTGVTAVFEALSARRSEHYLGGSSAAYVDLRGHIRGWSPGKEGAEADEYCQSFERSAAPFYVPARGGYSARVRSVAWWRALRTNCCGYLTENTTRLTPGESLVVTPAVSTASIS